MSDSTPVPSTVQGMKQGQSCQVEFLKQAPGIAFQKSPAVEAPCAPPADIVTRRLLPMDVKAGEKWGTRGEQATYPDNLEAETLPTLKPFI